MRLPELRSIGTAKRRNLGHSSRDLIAAREMHAAQLAAVAAAGADSRLKLASPSASHAVSVHAMLAPHTQPL